VVICRSLPFLAALLLPALEQGKRAGVRIACANNLRQIGLGSTCISTATMSWFPSSPGTHDWPLLSYFPCYVTPGTGRCRGILWVSGLCYGAAGRHPTGLTMPSRGSQNAIWTHENFKRPRGRPCGLRIRQAGIRVCYTYFFPTAGNGDLQGPHSAKVTYDRSVIEVGAGTYEVTGPSS